MSLLNKASLIQIPSGYKDGTLYSAKPTNGDGDFTFSRGSNLAATRVNSEGLIEKGRENLFTYSNDFSNAVWDYTTNGLTRTASSIIDPNGGTNAWEITTTATNEHHRLGHIITSGQVKTFSFYAKANGYEYVRVWAFSGGNTGTNYFHLSDEGTAIANGQLGIASIESVGNGWYRCQGVLDPVNSSAVVISPAPDANTAASTATYLADGTSGIYLYNAQLEQGLVATDYIPTTTTTEQAGILEDMPRLDYSGGASCPALLLEPQRSNVITQSEYFGAWSKSYAGTGSLPIITVNEAISPEGLQNASKIILDKGSGQTSGDYAFIQLGTTMTGDATYSIYLKSATSSSYEVALRIVNTITTVTVNSEWQRFDISATSTTNPTAGIWLRGGYNSSDYAEFYAYGAEVEAGSYPTSYIPTYGSSVTRSQDKCYKAGIADLIGNNTTVFVDFIAQDQDAYCDIVAIDGGATSEIIELQQSSSNGLNAILYRSGFVANIPATSSLITGTRYKAAFRIKTNDFAFYLNGVLQGTDTSGTYNGDSVRLNLSGYAASTNNSENAKISSCVMFNTALTNDELADLTTI